MLKKLPRIQAPRLSKKHLIALSTALVVGALLMPSANAASVVIDVRTPEEYQVGHPDGAINIPHNQLVAQLTAKGIDKSDTIKVYSRGGARAEQAKNALQSAGYANVEVQK